MKLKQSLFLALVTLLFGVVQKRALALPTRNQNGNTLSPFERRKGVLLKYFGAETTNTGMSRIRGGADHSGRKALGGFDLALAGALATMFSDAAAHPIDCIKTLQQSTEGAELNMLAASRKIFQKSGIGGFYSGLGTYVVSDGCAGALKFATYEAVKKWTKSNIQEEYQGVALFGCAALAFLASSFVLVPGELLKQRLQMGMISSVPDGISTIWRNEGLLGFFRGYSAVCFRDVPYTMLELGIYDNLKSTYLRIKNRNAELGELQKITTFDEFVAAAISGAITGFLTNPLDTIKTKVVVDPTLYAGFFDCMVRTVRDKGFGSLFQGAAARVTWIMPFTAIYLPTYEIIKGRLGAHRLKNVRSANVKQPIKVNGGAQFDCERLNRTNRCPRMLKRLERTDSFVSF